MLYWIIGIVVLIVVVLYFLDREIYFYEATHLGPRLQAWLYNSWAAKYDQGKKESLARDAEMLARPVLDFIKDNPAPLVFDLATGTGRMPLALLREPEFNGHVIAADVSVGMLTQAAQKLGAYQPRFLLVRKIGYPLPFPDSAFDVVSCMEALEVMAEIETPLVELYRILKPGGMLISSRATAASGRKAKVRSPETFAKTLQDVGFEQVDIVPWWRWFDRVTARKPGNLSPGGSMLEVFVCEQCHTSGLEMSAGLKCPRCGNKISQDASGILLM